MAVEGSIEDLLEEYEAYRLSLIKGVRDRDTLVEAALELVYKDITIASKYIDCPYCRRHMELEAGEVMKVLKRIKSEGNRRHRHSIAERLAAVPTAFKITFYVILGGLRRAGII